MTDTTEGAPAEPQQPAPVKMNILGQYVRDMSFENMLMQKGATGEINPEVQVQVQLDAKKRPADHQYEVISKYTVTSKNKADGATLFLVELDYAGIFHIENVPDDQLHPFLLIECPRMIFPFVRRIVSDLTRDGGFPPYNMDTVDFLAIYRAEAVRRAEAQKENAPTN